MKKIIVCLVLLCLFTTNINAACDNKKVVEYGKYASNINYEINYSKSSKKFSVTIYNLLNDMAVNYDNKIYLPKDSKVIFDNLRDGSELKIQIFVDKNCNSQIRSIYISIPYYNKFYNSSKCANYKMLSACNKEFLNYYLDAMQLDDMIENYKKPIIELKEENKEEVKNITFIDTIINFLKQWWLKILIVIIVSIVTIIPLKIKLRKTRYKF